MNEVSHSCGKTDPIIRKKYKAVIRYPYDTHYITNEDFKRKEFKAYQENVETAYLTGKKLNRLHELNLSESKFCVRDCCIISNYTGLHYSDLIRLEQKHPDFEQKLMTIITQKTSTLV